VDQANVQALNAALPGDPPLRIGQRLDLDLLHDPLQLVLGRHRIGAGESRSH